jgi:hypothetical protein
MGYAMVLAALYNDQTTFDKLSATIQAGIPLGQTTNGVKTNLFPWSWKPSGTSNNYTPQNDVENSNVYDSASDGDVNIGLSYVYADMAATTYGWSVKPMQGGTLSYKAMAQAYIAAIRLKDFTYLSTQSTANKHILTLGAQSALEGIKDWRPDYSDIRAYQLFALYDTSFTAFWNDAIAYTKESWKAVFYFGTQDTGRTTWKDTAPPLNVDMNASSTNVYISNSKYTNLTFSSDYRTVKATRVNANPYWAEDCPGTKTCADSSRMPIRIMNYVNAKQNSADQQMIGIASSIMSARGSSWKTSGYQKLIPDMDIWSPWYQKDTWIQDYIAAGLFTLASNTSLSSLDGMDKTTSLSNLNTGFGTDGTNGTFTWWQASDSKNYHLPDLNHGFNASLTLWGMTVSKDGHTDLQTAVDSMTSGTALLFDVSETGRVKSVNLTIALSNIGAKKIKVTLTSPDGRTLTILNQLVKSSIVLTNKNIGGFIGRSAKGKWRLNIDGSSSVEIGIRNLIVVNK